MKNKYFIFLLIISICSLNFVKINGQERPLLGKTIYVDPGHGGKDAGASYKDIYESDINLSISLILREKLELMGATVYLTRTDDYDLSSIGAYMRKRSDLNARAKTINDSKADMYISIHLNSTTSSKWRGAQVFYDDINDSNKNIALELTKSLGTKREVKEIKNMYLNKQIKIPGVLVEVGFLSNYYDRQLLITNKYQEEVANKIVKGIINYYGN